MVGVRVLSSRYSGQEPLGEAHTSTREPLKGAVLPGAALGSPNHAAAAWRR